MTPQELIKKIEKLPERAPHTEALEKLLLKKPQWYANQKQHWLGWLREYRNPGAYGRMRFDRDAEFAYNHCGCPPMALWLGEAAGVDERLVKQARRDAVRSPDSFSSKCASIRRNISWGIVAVALLT
ncbi:MAG: hypothetical protein JSR89_18280 [Proteobacteria bacterium]|nr:hypothetical protein [Pseudomonadota bacterium]